MPNIPHVQAGDPITADLYNAVAEKLERLLNLRSGSPYVRIWETPYGKSIALALPEPTYAILSGSTSPYAFVEVRDGPGGTWDTMPNGDSGVAYEANGKSGLDGKVVPIEWTSAGDWRFAWTGFGCVPGTSSILVTVNDSCASTALSGATVTVKLGTTTVATGTTDGSGHFSASITSPGNYTLTVSKTGYTTQTGIPFNGVACGTTNTKTVTLTPNTGSAKLLFAGNCQTGTGPFPIPGATVTATQGATVVATGTTDASGNATLTGIPLGVSTTFSATNSDYSTQTGTKTAILTNPCTLVDLGLATVTLNANHHCVCWIGYPDTNGGTCLVGNTLLCSTPWGDCTLTWNSTTFLWEGLLSTTVGCPARGCGSFTSTLTVKYGNHPGEGCGWSISGVFCSGGTAPGRAFIPGGGDHGHGTETDTGTGGCSPFFATTTITYHTPSPWGAAELLFCAPFPSPTYTFSVMEP